MPAQYLQDKDTLQVAAVTDSGALRTASALRLVGVPFVGTVKDPNFWTESDVGSGAVSQATGQIVLTTGTIANSSAQYSTNQVGLFIPGAENTYRGDIQFGDTGTANNKRLWGAFNALNGIYFKLGASLSIGTRSNGVDTVVAQTSWNVSTAFVLDTNLHTWEIRYTFLGIYFFIDHVLVHQILTAGLAVVPCPILDLPATAQTYNINGSTTNCSMTVVTMYLMRTGSLQTEGIYNYINTDGINVLKYGAGKLHNVIIGNGLGGILTLYDGTSPSSPIISVLNITLGTNYPVTVPYECLFNTGLTAGTTGVVSLTIVYE